MNIKCPHFSKYTLRLNNVLLSAANTQKEYKYECLLRDLIKDNEYRQLIGPATILREQIDAYHNGTNTLMSVQKKFLWLLNLKLCTQVDLRQVIGDCLSLEDASTIFTNHRLKQQYDEYKYGSVGSRAIGNDLDYISLFGAKERKRHEELLHETNALYQK